MFTQQLKERDAIPSLPIHAASINGANKSGAVDMSKFNRVQFLCTVGTLGSSATIDAVLQETNEANGANSTNFATTINIAQINAANKAFTLEVRADQCTKRYVLCLITVGTAASVCACFPVGTEARYGPVTGGDHADVSQRIAG